MTLVSRQPVWLKAVRTYVRLSSPIGFLARNFLRKVGGRSAEAKYVSGGLCIDVGAGTAPYRRDIERFLRIGQYVAFDLAVSDVTNVAGDAMHMPFRDCCARLVTSFDVIQHVPDSRAVLAEAARILAPGGLLLLTFPFNYCECDMQDYRRWTLSGMEQDVSNCGLDVVHMEQRGGRFFSFACALNWVVQHLIPGQRKGWRAKRSAFGLFRSAFILILTLPTTALQWLMLGLDHLFQNKGCYMGGVVLAVKRVSVNSSDVRQG
jgi:SAM-dependent methyltransferase